MDLLDGYGSQLTEGFTEAEILGRKIMAKRENRSLHIYDVDDLLSSYRHEYIVVQVIFGDDSTEIYEGKLIRNGGRMYFVDATQKDPLAIAKKLEEIIKSTPNWIPAQFPSPLREDSGTTWTTWTTTSVPLRAVELDTPNRNGNVYMSSNGDIQLSGSISGVTINGSSE